MAKKVFITRQIPDPGIPLLKKAGFQVEVYPKNQMIPKRLLLKKVKDIDALLCLLTDRIDESVFKAGGDRLKIVANYAVGYNNIDVEASKKYKTMVTNTPAKLLSTSVAEHTFGLRLAVSKRIVEADRYTRAGKYKGWGPTLLLGMLLQGKTLGLIGTGRIGSKVAVQAKALGMKILYNDLNKNSKLEKLTKAKYATKHQLLKQSDIVSIHVPLLPSTRHLIGAKDLRVMKKTAYLINTSRGPVINEKSLTIALEKGIIAGAGIDVFECEPAIDCDLTDTHELRKLDNVVMTPHTASAAIEARSEMAELAAKNVIAALKGKRPKNLVK